MADIWIVNGVNLAGGPVYPRDGLCLECGHGIYGIELRSVIAEEKMDGSVSFITAVEPALIEGPFFRPCGHDARRCFPAVPDGG